MNTIKEFVASLLSRKFLLSVAAFATALSQHSINVAAVVAAVYVAAQAYENANTTK